MGLIKDLLYKQCPTCKGKGFPIEQKVVCNQCLGTGAIRIKEEK